MLNVVTPSWPEAIELFHARLTNIKVLDLRSLPVFCQGHFLGAVHYVPTLMVKKRLNQTNAHPLLGIAAHLHTLVVCYDTTSSNLAKTIQVSIETNTTLTTMYMLDLTEKKIPDELRVSIGHHSSTQSKPTGGDSTVTKPSFTGFRLSLPAFSTPGFLSPHALEASRRKQAIKQQQPSRILPFLYLGNDKDAHNDAFIRDNGINYIINITTQVTNKYPDITYLTLRAADNQGTHINQYFLLAIQFIEQARTAGKRILVHCNRGISRSATLVMAYLLFCQYRDGDNILLGEEKKRDEHSVYAKVKIAREIISPNFRFHCELARFEGELRQLPFAKYYEHYTIMKLQSKYALADHDLTWLIQDTTKKPLAITCPA